MADPTATRTALRAGTVPCPQDGCQGVLRAWSRARARPVLMGGAAGLTRVQVRPDRARCRACGVTQVLLPASCLPRRAYGAEVVGAALSAAADGSGYRCVATRIGVPASTVRAWIRSTTRSTQYLTGTALRLMGTLGADTSSCWITGPGTVHPVRAALQALGSAAQAFTQAAVTASRCSPGTLTGIDYLGQLATNHLQELYGWLRLSDPTGAAATAPPWHQVTMITGGRLFTTARSG